MKSLRGRLLIGLLSLWTASAIAAGAAAYWLDRREVDDSLDVQLRQLALTVGDSDYPVATRAGDGVSIEREDEFVVTIWDQAGQARSSDRGFSTPRPVVTGYTDFEAVGERWRAFSKLEGARAAQVAQRKVVREEFATNSALRAVLPIAALLPLSWLLVGWVVSRVLRPLHVMTDELRQWGRTGGADLLSLDNIPNEVLPLATATNDLVTRLQRQLDFREQFISDAAHELRTPLTALRLQARNLGARATSSEQAALVGEMAEGVRRMSNIVAKLLQLARADSTASARTAVPVDLARTVAASLQDVVPVAAEKGIDIGMLGTVDEHVMGDPDELRILIGNLVENAVRYTPDGGVVDLAVERTGREVVLEVRDTGPGIPDDLIERVFARFVRAPGAKVEGSGLGLPIVKAIADRCGARISLFNRKDRSGLVARVCFIEAGRIGPAPFPAG